MRGIKTIIIAAIMAAMATFILILFQNNSRMNDELTRLRDQLRAAEPSPKEPATAVMTNEPSLNQEQMNELLRLRGQVGSLKRQLAEAAKAGAAANLPSASSNGPADPAWEDIMKRQAGYAKMNIVKDWTKAFMIYASSNQNQFPTSFDQAFRYLEEANNDTLARAAWGTNHFEIVFQGSISGQTNPGNIMVLRETEAFQSPNGGWNKTYSFLDGHSEIHHEADGNFGPWEQSRSPKPPGQ